jgi:hypothetical protein
LETLQILLVGGRQIPNFLGVMLLRPDRVHFLVSKDNKNALDNLYETLAKMEGLVLPDKSQLPDIDANDYQANIALTSPAAVRLWHLRLMKWLAMKISKLFTLIQPKVG